MILDDLEKLIFDFADANGADWLALITGGIFPGRAPDCAAGQSPKTPYCVWNWVGVSDIRTATNLRDREYIQFVFYGTDRKKVNEITEGCVDLFAASFWDLKDLSPDYPDLRMRHGDQPYVPATYDDTDKSRFALWVGMAQFYIDATKTMTET